MSIYYLNKCFTMKNALSLSLNHLSSINNFATYSQYVSKIPILTEEEESRLVNEYYNNKNIAAGQTLILHHLRLVVKIAFEYQNYGKIMDMISEGNVGLAIAIKKFDPSKGVRIATYASNWIRFKIQEFIINSWSILSGGTSKIKEKLFLKSDKDENIGIHSSVSLDSYDSNTADSIASQAGNQLENLIKRTEMDHNTEMLQQSMAKLNEREKYIIHSRYYSDKKTTLHEIADKFGISKERVRQIETEALKKLKKGLKPL